MRVLIVDDSIVFRTSISTSLASVSGIEVAGTAPNGKIALQKMEQGSIDLVTLDMEMPDMNGIEVLKQIRKIGYKVRVIIFSSQTPKGAALALDALKAGADDVVAKPSGDQTSFEFAAESIRQVLLPKIQQFTKDNGSNADRSSNVEGNVLVPSRPSSLDAIPKKRSLMQFVPKAIVIGCSTGGPNALEEIFSKFTAPSRVPILIVQHMPPVFTEVLAKRIGELSGIPAVEARDGDEIENNKIYVAPGDFHMLVTAKGDKTFVSLNKDPKRSSVRPAVDYLFESSANVWGSNLLGFVLTGMGEDGWQGARAIRSNGGGIIIQDEASCVVFGMPGAIFNAGDYDEIMPLKNIGLRIQRAISNGI